MCGIVGEVVYSSLIDKSLFELKCDSITHRGPDDAGVWISDDLKIALGSKRLAIQDTSINGHMPMLNLSNNLVLVFNGEIYNYPTIKLELLKKGYRFKTTSDTEVVLYAYEEWGVDCLNRFNGMFSFAIYDISEKKIIIARDRAGEKPLYYKFNSSGFEFASELNVFLVNTNNDRKLNYDNLNYYLKFGYSLPNKSMVQGIDKLEAGSYIIYDIVNKSINTNKYWKIPEFNNKLNYSVEDLVTKLDGLISASVSKQLLSDVPVGILLSGGLDSSLIAAYAADHSSTRIKTFNMSFKGNEKYDESKYAKIVADYFNTEHHVLNGNDITYDLLEEIANLLDEPLADSSLIPTFLLSYKLRSHVKVALGGDGGDELFGGYQTYKKLLNIASVKKGIPKYFRNNFKHLVNHIPSGFKGKNYLLNFSGGIYDSFNIEKYFHQSDLDFLMNGNFKSNLKINDIKLNQDVFYLGCDPIYTATSLDFSHYLCDDILFKVDRASMLNSIEMRAPWLDQELIHFAFAEVPSNLKVTKNKNKILPKLLSDIKLPPKLNIERKQGFSFPINKLIYNEWFDEIKSELQTLPGEIFNIPSVIKLFENSSRFGLTNHHKFYSLVILNKWLKKHKISY